MAKAGETARRAAFEALRGVIEERRMLAIPEGLPGAEAARAGRLAQTVLRHMPNLDAILAPFVARRPAPAVQILLRLAAAELLVDGAAAHGVVDGYVALAKRVGGRTARAAGLLNAVLRRVAEGGAERFDAMAPPRLPAWLRKRLKSAWGAEAVTAMEAVHAQVPPIDLTARDTFALDGAETLPTGSLRLPAGAQVSALPGYDAGAFWVQDAAAALPARLLGDVRGRDVLDLCAAPGGKTLQLAAMGARVTAVDASAERMERLGENLARTGLGAEILVADARAAPEGPWDAILLDAPCSATGTIRRHPELPHIRGAAEVARLTALQAELIDAAAARLAPGGRLVVCTCSLLPEEGEGQIHAALRRHPHLVPVPVDPATLGGETSWADGLGGLRIRPDHWAARGGIDGFHMIALLAR